MNLDLITQPNLTPQPRTNIRIQSLTASPYPDNTRIHILLTTTPFTPNDRPSIKITLTSHTNITLTETNIIETPHNSVTLTLHTHHKFTPGETANLHASLYYNETQPNHIHKTTITF